MLLGALPPGTELNFVWALCLSVLLGSIMGLERSIAGKHAGIRTYAMVSLGSCAFTIISTLASLELSTFAGINPLQIAGSIVIGIGFIGTGLAAFRGEHPVELTTASGIWAVAAVGMACGYGFYILAAATTALSLIIFSFLAYFEYWLRTFWGTQQPK